MWHRAEQTTGTVCEVDRGSPWRKGHSKGMELGKWSIIGIWREWSWGNHLLEIQQVLRKSSVRGSMKEQSWHVKQHSRNCEINEEAAGRSKWEPHTSLMDCSQSLLLTGDKFLYACCSVACNTSMDLSMQRESTWLRAHLSCFPETSLRTSQNSLPSGETVRHP